LVEVEPAPATLPGWRRSADRAGLRPNSLLTGNFTGNFAIFGFQNALLEQEVAVPQRPLAQFPTRINRENILKNREFLFDNREFVSSGGKRPFLAHFCSGL
jgi:hypothetical protein